MTADWRIRREELTGDRVNLITKIVGPGTEYYTVNVYSTCGWQPSCMYPSIRM